VEIRFNQDFHLTSNEDSDESLQEEKSLSDSLSREDVDIGRR